MGHNPRIMKYNKIRGKSVADCMMKLRSLYGSSAIILNTREVDDGGILGSSLFSKKAYEIDFMVEEARSSRPVARREGLDSLRTKSKPLSETPTKQPLSKKMDDEAEKLLADLKKREAKEQGDLFSKPEGPRPPHKQPELEPEEVAALLEDEPAIAQAVLGELKESSKASKPEKEGDIRYLSQVRKRLLGAQLSQGFTSTFLHSLDDSLSRLDKKEPRKLEERSVEKLASMIRMVPDLAPPRGECRAVMLVGPTGNGKTTSIAKLGAKYHIFENREVSLYSLDHYRLAATEQLKTYASVMGLPFYAPLNPAEFRECIRRDGAELMLIDTSGIGHNDNARLNELKKFVEICEVRLEIHLVLAANTNPVLVKKILEAYEDLGFDKILLTKLDETEFIGAFVEYADKFNRPFSFLMNGQEVPGDILEAKPIELAKMVLAGRNPEV